MYSISPPKADTYLELCLARRDIVGKFWAQIPSYPDEGYASLSAISWVLDKDILGYNVKIGLTAKDYWFYPAKGFVHGTWNFIRPMGTFSWERVAT